VWGCGLRRGGDVEVKSEIYAIVWKIQVAEGADVAADDVLMILESMKMVIPVTAPEAGRVRSIAVTEGDSVQEDDVLVVLDPRP
jgi:acetyl-CoA carboxylase biotin carboxyl carrier protein